MSEKVRTRLPHPVLSKPAIHSLVPVPASRRASCGHDFSRRGPADVRHDQQYSHRDPPRACGSGSASEQPAARMRSHRRAKKKRPAHSPATPNPWSWSHSPARGVRRRDAQHAGMLKACRLHTSHQHAMERVDLAELARHPGGGSIGLRTGDVSVTTSAKFMTAAPRREVFTCVDGVEGRDPGHATCASSADMASSGIPGAEARRPPSSSDGAPAKAEMPGGTARGRAARAGIQSCRPYTAAVAAVRAACRAPRRSPRGAADHASALTCLPPGCSHPAIKRQLGPPG